MNHELADKIWESEKVLVRCVEGENLEPFLIERKVGYGLRWFRCPSTKRRHVLLNRQAVENWASGLEEVRP